jgi:Arabinose-binding domain of AraC transcription regulator, N-term
VVGFLNAAARAAAERNLGLLIAPMMDAANYGGFGRYVLEAETLGKSIERAISALCYHSTDDRMSIAVVGEEARYSYRFALAGRTGYDNIAPPRLVSC